MDLLPPQELRDCGEYCRSDKDWIATGNAEVERMVARGLNADSWVLEIGCGAGRFATALQRRFGTMRQYLGVDVDGERIAWCRNALPAPSWQFSVVDVQNDRYNPGGKQTPDVLVDGSSRAYNRDFIYAYAVLLHMVPEHCQAYLSACERLLADGGEMFATFHVENWVPDVEINPQHYPRHGQKAGDKRDALHAVRYSWPRLSDMIEQAGLYIAKVTNEPWRRQTGLYLRRRS